MNKRHWFLIATCFASGVLLADVGGVGNVVQAASQQLGVSENTLFQPAVQDLSRSYLSMIFGAVGAILPGTSSQFVGEIFKIFNLGLLVFAGSFVSYSAVTTVLNASQDGGPAGTKANPWVPFRLVAGVSLLIPMYSGYSMIQVLVMWAVMQGVGLADTMWSKAVDVIKLTGGAAFSTSISNNDIAAISTILGTPLKATNNNISVTITEPLQTDANQIFYAALCLAVKHRNNIIDAHQQQQNDRAAQAMRAATQGGDQTVPVQTSPVIQQLANYGMRVGAACPATCTQNTEKCRQQIRSQFCFGTEDAPAVCGNFYAHVEENASVSHNARLRQGTFAMAEQLFTQVDQIFSDAYTQALSNDLSQSDIACGGADSTQLTACRPSDTLLSAASVYYGLTKPIFLNHPKTTSSSSDWAKSARDAGWIAAASHYHDMVASNALDQKKTINITDFKAEKPMIASGFVIQFSDLKDASIQTAYKTIIDAMFRYNGLAQYMLTVRNMANNMSQVIASDGNANASGDNSQATDQKRTDKLTEKIYIKPSLLEPLNQIISRVLNTFLYAGAYGTGAFQAKSLVFSNVTLTLASTNIQVLMGYVMGALTGLHMLNDDVWEKGSETLGFNPIGHTGLSGKESAACNAVKTSCSIKPVSQSYVNMMSLASFMQDFNKVCTHTTSDAVTTQVLNPGCPGSDDAAKMDEGSNCGIPHQCKETAFNLAKKTQEALYKTWEDNNSSKGQCAYEAINQHCVMPGIGIVGSMVARAQGKQSDPLFNLANLGLTMMSSAASYYIETTNGIYRISKLLLTDYTIVMSTASILSGVAGGLVGGGGGDAIMGVGGILNQVFQMLYKFDVNSLGLMLPLGASIAGVFFILGIVLGVYLPLMPFLVYVFTVIGWIIAVIEAMVAAPLVALGVTHPQGHDLLGKSEQAMILLLGIFIRPAAILLGFIFAISLLYIAAELVNYGFIMTIANYLSTEVAGNSVIVRSVVIGGMLVAYAYIMMQVVEQVFGLIYQVPEKLLRWIGAAPEQSGVGQKLGQIKQGVQSSGQQAAQGAGSVAGQRPQIGDPKDVPNSKDIKKAVEKPEEKPDEGAPDVAG